MRTLDVKCDNCGATQPTPRPNAWWLLEDHGRIMRTGPLDFCSLHCLQRWLADPDVRRAYRADWNGRWNPDGTQQEPQTDGV